MVDELGSLGGNGLTGTHDDDPDVSDSDLAFGRDFRGRGPGAAPGGPAVHSPGAYRRCCSPSFPGLPTLQLAPDLVLVLVLPPLVYSSAVAMSWREFRFNLRPIALLAVGCVVFTTIAVAAATHWLLGFPWAVGFVLGAIVSPPDAVAPLSIARRMQLPRRLLVILEGEGLANDATALVLYRFAVVAVSIGSFSFAQAAGSLVGDLAARSSGELGVGWLMLRLRRWVRDPKVEIMLSILTPYRGLLAA